MKRLCPGFPRFRWSYDRRNCYDTLHTHKWVLKTINADGHVRYFFRRSDGHGTTPACTRVTTAVRGLMRYIAARDPE